jgi:uncharacterized protein YciW
MTTAAEASRIVARTELRSWYLDHLRPRLATAVAAGVVEAAALQQIDFELAGLFELPDELERETT